MQKSENNLQKNLRDLLLAEKCTEAVSLLYNQQSENWQLLKDGIESLSSVEVKKFYFNGYEICTQFNPGRIISTTANTSPEAVKKRECFLCTENLPEEQQGIICGDNYQILCNPYPIFLNHYTISSIGHTPQRIKNSFTDLLNMSSRLPEYCFIYNGPECGASAPDHLHFQACKMNSLPVHLDYEGLKNEFGEEIINDGVNIYAIDDGIRKMFALESVSSESINKVFNRLYSLYAPISKSHVEPKMNIISSFEKEMGWRIIIFLRKKHRPDVYFKEDDENILVSPASIDLGGVLITPLEKDYKKITREIIMQIFREVSIGKEEFEYLKTKLKE